MSQHRGKHRGKKKNANDKKMAEALDQLSDYEDFMKQIPKEVRNALLEGASASDIYKQFSHIAAARAVVVAMTEKDSGKALQAAKEILDRSEGKAVERKENTHKFDKLSEEELDSMLASELEELDEDEKDSKGESTTH